MSENLQALLNYLQINSKKTIKTSVVSCYYFEEKTYIYQHKNDFVTIFGSSKPIYEIGQLNSNNTSPNEE